MKFTCESRFRSYQHILLHFWQIETIVFSKITPFITTSLFNAGGHRSRISVLSGLIFIYTFYFYKKLHFAYTARGCSIITTIFTLKLLSSCLGNFHWIFDSSPYTTKWSEEPYKKLLYKHVHSLHCFLGVTNVLLLY